MIGLHLVSNLPELRGAHVRFLRKELDLSQVDLGDILGVGESSIGNWENGRGRITKPADRLLRNLYREHVKGNGTIRELIERIGQLNHDLHDSRLVFSEQDHQWFADEAA